MAAVKYLDETGLNTLWTKQQKLRWADVNRWAASMESANNSLVTLDTLADGTGWTVTFLLIHGKYAHSMVRYTLWL